MSESKHDFWLIPAAFFIVYIVWGATYLANAWGVEVVPPFLFAGSRFVIAGGILLLFTRLFQPIEFTQKQLINTIIAGFMLFAVGNGLVVWALKYIDSGITALLIALQPLIVAMMIWLQKGIRPNTGTWIGIGLGLIGMFFLVGQPVFTMNSDWLMGLAAVGLAILAWSYMSIWIPSADLPPVILQSSAFQMIFGGIMMFVISYFLEDTSGLTLSAITPKVLWSFVFLVILGSIFAFSSFQFLLKKVSPTKVVSSAYINPLVALFLGWWLNHELLSTQTLIATALLLTGVVFIIKAKEQKTK